MVSGMRRTDRPAEMTDRATPPATRRPNHASGHGGAGLGLDDALDAGCLFVTVALVTVLALGGRSVVRDVAAVVFTVFVPGWAVVSNWPAVGRRSRVAASVVVSLSLLTLVATVTLWLHYWHPVGTAEIEGVATVAALTTALARRSTRARHQGTRA
jgi:uncharacterized membrane protein